MTLITLALSAYAITFVLTSSSILQPLRAMVMKHTPWFQIGMNRHFVECRMCVGFWISAVVCFPDWHMFLPVYGLSYFLATQERG